MGDSMFLIARGIATVSLTEKGRSRDLAMLYAGDFFGESALLHETPRNATATAATPCSLYELNALIWIAFVMLTLKYAPGSSAWMPSGWNS